MPFHVQRQVIAPRKRSLTEMALERLLACVLAIVPRQFVGAREFPRAALPFALIGFLACNRYVKFSDYFHYFQIHPVERDFSHFHHLKAYFEICMNGIMGQNGPRI